MNALRLTVAFAAFQVATVCFAFPDDANPQEKLETAIPEAIRLLESKEFETFLKKFAPPDDLKKMTQQKSIGEIAGIFGERKAPRLLEVLQAAQGIQPTLDSDGKKATYQLKEPIDRMKSLTFVKVEKLWYIQN